MTVKTRANSGPHRARARKAAPTATDIHREWLELVDTEGPFLSIPALKNVRPQGFPVLDADRKATLTETKPAFEKAWENWDQLHDDEAAQESALELYRAERDTWVDTILREVIGWQHSYTTDLSGPDFVEVVPARSPNHDVAVTATGALVHGDLIGALVLVVDPVKSLRDPLEDGWAASPIDRMTELLHESRVPIGVVTDGRWWGVVCARPGAVVASGIVDAQSWIEDPRTRDALFDLLSRRQLIGGDPAQRLPKLFENSVKSAEEITEALGTQVRQAVELLVQALSESALDVIARGEPDPLPQRRSDVYEAAVTVMMRVVFLLFAEERGLLPQSRLFAGGYGISGELDTLQPRATAEGAEVLDRTSHTWHRLLATCHALYRGASFEDIRIPSYGGSLFDPDRYPFLAARDERGLLVTVSDRVMLAVLQAVQIAVVDKIPGRVSFRDVDVEQIGYIYEGLLGYSCSDVDEVTVGLVGTSGQEPEIPLASLESLAEANRDPAELAAAVFDWAKTHQAAAKTKTVAALTKALKNPDPSGDAESALRSITTDPELQDRLRPFLGIIRRDLRNRPFVIQPGGVLVVETASRANAGAHYTPKNLAEEVVLHALEPLVYQPGPHQTADQDKWKPISSDQLLELKIADIACGSGAFLVAAARYLASRLVEAWEREGSPNASYTKAVRHVVARCLYGADINAMAVEMCKLSLWLVSLDPALPFSFVDDKILHGNSLLGLVSIDQLEQRHIYPDSGEPTLSAVDIEGRLQAVATLRRSLANPVDNTDPQRSANHKRYQFHKTQELTRELADIADGVIAAGLRAGGKPGKALTTAYVNLGIALDSAYPIDDSEPDRAMLEEIQRAGLTPSVATDYDRWKPLHWILAVPDVMARGGFDAIIGNPPFLGGKKLTGSMGTELRDWYVDVLASGRRGHADLVAYFLQRAMSLLSVRGNFGLIATNTIAQGDTREVGLDTLVASGVIITRAIQSRPWPSSSANLEYAGVWGTRDRVADGVPRIADDVPVQKISTLLEPAGRADGLPIRLVENSGIAFIGCFVFGMGFVLEPDEAAAWRKADPTNCEVLFPYLNGQDLNSRPDFSASRWVIDFHDMPEAEVRRYELPWSRVLERVKPERKQKPKAVRDAPWWRFFRARPALRKAIVGLEEVLAIALVSSVVMPVRVQAGQVFSHALGVFATDSFADQAVLASSLHQLWAITYGSTLETRIRYTPSDVFDTFPRPRSTDFVAEIGRALDTERREIMIRRDLGLTKLYNVVNDPDITDSADPDVARLREIHVELDTAVMAAYGWDDMPLDHGFHTYRQMQRWTVSPAARVEILDRLLEENHRRAALQGDEPEPAADDDTEEDDE
ncbi:MAG: SAM-dependent DNA methyltransferase [Mycobacteriaceae bacterium]|nr:SAM-dependent DNA methyltransferase [Mycobacteriaceae bacterium]